MYQIDYEKFIEIFNVNKNYYDSNHIIINYSDSDIKNLIETCDVIKL